MSDFDISHILQRWPYDPERNVRRIASLSGTEKLQVRLPLGVEQYELDGRPDGLCPDGCESYLELFQHRCAEAGGGFSLSHLDCRLLYEEGVLYYFRYYLCFQIADFDRVIRDTQRNLAMFDFADRYAKRDEGKARLNQHRPYVMRMRASAKALQLAATGEYERGADVLREAIDGIEMLEPVQTETWRVERDRSVSILQGMLKETQEKAPPSKTERIRCLLDAAVSAENYERAARLRDILHRMGRGA